MRAPAAAVPCAQWTCTLARGKPPAYNTPIRGQSSMQHTAALQVFAAPCSLANPGGAATPFATAQPGAQARGRLQGQLRHARLASCLPARAPVVQ